MLHRQRSDLMSLITSEKVTLVVSLLAMHLTTAGPFESEVKCELCGEKISMSIHRNIRCFITLVENAEVPVSASTFDKVRAVGPASEYWATFD